MLKGNIDCLTLVRHSFYGAPRSRISVADCVVFFFFFAPRLLNYKSFTDVRLPRVFFLAIFFANQQYHSQYWWLRRLHHFTFHIRREYFFFCFLLFWLFPIKWHSRLSNRYGTLVILARALSRERELVDAYMSSGSSRIGRLHLDNCTRLAPLRVRFVWCGQSTHSIQMHNSCSAFLFCISVGQSEVIQSYFIALLILHVSNVWRRICSGGNRNIMS